jgi:hypothetical protein
MVGLALAIANAIAVAISVAVADSVANAIAITITHRHCCCCQPLPLWLPLTIPVTISVMLPSPIHVAVALAVGHCRLCQRRPSQLPSPSAITVAMLSAISESCCLLGAKKKEFNQLKQRMLTLFNFVPTVGGALIKAERLTRCQSAMANTSVGRQAASIEPIVREVAGSRGAAGGQKGGDVD